MPPTQTNAQLLASQPPGRRDIERPCVACFKLQWSRHPSSFRFNLFKLRFANLTTSKIGCSSVHDAQPHHWPDPLCGHVSRRHVRGSSASTRDGFREHPGSHHNDGRERSPVGRRRPEPWRTLTNLRGAWSRSWGCWERHWESHTHW